MGERLNIVQHPGGGPQKVGLRRNELESVDGDYLIYGTDTEPGSSGSPVCNDQWLLAALHHASVPELDDEGRFVRWVANEGVRISRVVAEARERLRQSTESTNALFDAAFANVPEWASEAPRPGLRSEGSVEIPLRLTLQVSAAGVPGTSATPGAVALPGPQLEPAARDEFLTSPGLDYTIVAVGADYDESEARRRGWLNLIEESGKVLVGERLNIVQHPGGGPQKVGLRRNELESVDGDYLIYGTDTEPGSSGSPVCNDQWLLAALHHASVPELDDEGRFVRWVANEGVRISRVVAEARERLRQSTESTNALFDAAFANVPEWASEAPRPGLRSEGSVEIPLRLTLQVSAAGVPGTSATPGAVALPGPQLEPAARDEFLDPPDGLRAFANPAARVHRRADGRERTGQLHPGGTRRAVGCRSSGRRSEPERFRSASALGDHRRGGLERRARAARGRASDPRRAVLAGRFGDRRNAAARRLRRVPRHQDPDR